MPFGPYMLLKRLAVGGMAEIFLATDTRTRRFVVIKRILPYLAEDSEFLSMFLDEARIASLMHHDVIVQIYDLGHQDDTTYIAMEWVDGIDLRRILAKEEERGRVVPPGIASWIVAQLCEGLTATHTARDAGGKPLGIIHRDISPQNVMVTYKGGVKLVDFGIAKATAWATRSKPGVIKGKFLYLAPEQLGDGPVDGRVDLFAVGTLLYELTTGLSPFQRSSTEAVIFAVKTESPEPPTAVRPGYPPALSRIVMKCLEKDPGRRYQTADQIRAALADYLFAECPTSQDDVARYLNGLYGSEDERTSVYVPPNAERPLPPKEPETGESTARFGKQPMSLPPTANERVVRVESKEPLPTTANERALRVEPRRPTPAPPSARDVMQTMDLPPVPDREADEEPTAALGKPGSSGAWAAGPVPRASVTGRTETGAVTRTESKEARESGPRPVGDDGLLPDPTFSHRRVVESAPAPVSRERPGPPVVIVEDEEDRNPTRVGVSPAIDDRPEPRNRGGAGPVPENEHDDFNPTVALPHNTAEVSVTTPEGRKQKHNALVIAGLTLIAAAVLVVLLLARRPAAHRVEVPPAPRPAPTVVRVALRAPKGTSARLGTTELAVGPAIDLPVGTIELVVRCPERHGRPVEQRFKMQISPEPEGQVLSVDLPCR